MSGSFFRYFTSLYGCDVEIRQVKYERLEDMIDFKFRTNNGQFASFDVDPSSYFNIYKDKILALDLDERKKQELAMMTSHQDGYRSDGERYYYVDAGWIQKWLTFCDGTDYFKRKRVKTEPPGPINNTELERWISGVNQRLPEGDDTEKYYTVSKMLFYFFLSVYGGGPAIVQIRNFNQHEFREDPRVKIKEEAESDSDDH